MPGIPIRCFKSINEHAEVQSSCTHYQNKCENSAFRIFSSRVQMSSQEIFEYLTSNLTSNIKHGSRYFESIVAHVESQWWCALCANMCANLVYRIWSSRTVVLGCERVVFMRENLMVD